MAMKPIPGFTLAEMKQIERQDPFDRLSKSDQKLLVDMCVHGFRNDIRLAVSWFLRTKTMRSLEAILKEEKKLSAAERAKRPNRLGEGAPEM